MRAQVGSTLAHIPGGKPTRLTLPDGSALDYAYSAHGELQSVSIPGEGSISVNQYQWTAPSKTTLPGGVTQNRSLDGLLQLQDLQVNTPGQQTLLQVTNTWGKVQDLQAQSRTDTASSTGSTPISTTTSRSFAYDDEVRLTRTDHHLTRHRRLYQRDLCQREELSRVQPDGELSSLRWPSGSGV